MKRSLMCLGIFGAICLDIYVINKSKKEANRCNEICKESDESINKSEKLIAETKRIYEHLFED